MRDWVRGLKGGILLLLLVLVAFSVWAYPQLPERIPTHFGISGEPDAWSRRSIGAWFMLPAVGVFTTLLLAFVAELAGRRPEYVNLPAKARLLELPAEAQRTILGRARSFVLQINLLILLEFLAIQWGSWRASLGLPSRGVFVAILLLTAVALPVLTIAFVVGITSEINREHRKAVLRGQLSPGRERRARGQRTD